MLRTIPTVAAALLLGATQVAAQNVACDVDNPCPKDTPCCSQYGQCGVGAYCLGGCNPLKSFSMDSCAPAPVCESRTMSMDSDDGIMSINKYLGDPKSADWVSQGSPKAYNGHTLLTMPPYSAGTVLASTVYMWYGTVKARMKTATDAGVVTAFILFSDVQDEIDYEFVGVDLDVAQTNYYFQGITDYTNSKNLTGLGNSLEEWHDYEIRWTPEKVEWVIDGNVGRTLNKASTYNSTLNQYDFPQTPSRVQISIWPGGDAANPKGTRDWAGGTIDWGSQYIKENGYYYASLGEVTMECYQTDSAPGTNSGTSYLYTDSRGTNDTVIDTDKKTVLKSILGTGLDMDREPDEDDPAATGISVVPGGGDVGPGTGGHAGGSNSSPDTPSNTGPDVVGCTQGFQQDCSASSNDDGTPTSDGPRQDRLLGASAFAALIAVAGMLWL